MPTPSLKLPDELKQTAAEAAERQSVSPHERSAFVTDALAARAEVMDSGKAYPAQEVQDYIRAYVQEGRRISQPKARSWRG